MTAPVRLDPEQGLVRGVRAAVLTVPAVGSAGLAHVLTDGCGSLLATLAAAGLCWPAAVALLGSRRRLPALAAWVVLAQLVAHVLLERMCTEVVTGQVSLAAHLREGLTVRLVAVHLTAAVLTGVLLGRADAGLWSARALVRAGAGALRLAAALPALPSAPGVRSIAAVVTHVPLPRDSWESARPVRRGPPVRPAL